MHVVGFDLSGKRPEPSSRHLVVLYKKKASHYKAMVLWEIVEEYLNQ